MSDKKRRTITIDIDTGEWVSKDVSISGMDGKVVASAVLPGTTPEMIDQWYGEWMSNDH